MANVEIWLEFVDASFDFDVKMLMLNGHDELDETLGVEVEEVNVGIEDDCAAAPTAELEKLCIDISERPLLRTRTDGMVEDGDSFARELDNLATGTLFVVKSEGVADEEPGSTTELESAGAATLLVMETDFELEDDADDGGGDDEKLGIAMSNDTEEALLWLATEKIEKDVPRSVITLDFTTEIAAAEVLVNNDAVNVDALGEATGRSELDNTTTSTEFESGKTAEDCTLDTSGIAVDVSAKLDVVVLLGMIHSVDRDDMGRSEELNGEADCIKVGADDEAGADPSMPGRLELAARAVALFGAATLDWTRDDDGAAIGETLLGMRVLESDRDEDGAAIGENDELITAAFETEVETGDRGERDFEVAEITGATRLTTDTVESAVDDDGATTEMEMPGLDDGLAKLLLVPARMGGDRGNEDVDDNGGMDTEGDTEERGTLATPGIDDGLNALVLTTGGEGGGSRDSDGTDEGDTAEDPASAELAIGGLTIGEDEVKRDVRAGGGAGAWVVKGVKLSTPSVVTIVETATEAGTVDTTILEDVDNNGIEAIAELTDRVLAMLDVELSEDVDAAADELGLVEPTAPKPP
ncbi:hypothetical protein N431DRAFT_472056 [Stipitochalara longipes BDJ]|nr:hypothetical protein N431DRAFT_472056 [Stipitochalara longipes BDJ]